MSSFKILDFFNQFTSRYATIREISLSDNGLSVTAQLNGSSDTFTVRVGGIEFSVDGKMVSVTGLSSDIAWADNVFRDFIEGEQFPVPEAASGMVPMIQAVL